MSKSKFKVGDEVKFRRFYPRALTNQCDPRTDMPVFGKVYRVSEINSYGTIFVEGIKSSGFNETELMFVDIRKEIESGCFHKIEFTSASKKDREKLEHDYRLECFQLNTAYVDQAQGLLEERQTPAHIENLLSFKVYTENESLLGKFRRLAEQHSPVITQTKSPAKKFVTWHDNKHDSFYDAYKKEFYAVDYKCVVSSPQKVTQKYPVDIELGAKYKNSDGDVYKLNKENGKWFLLCLKSRIPHYVGGNWNGKHADIETAFYFMSTKWEKIVETVSTPAPTIHEDVGVIFNISGWGNWVMSHKDGKYALLDPNNSDRYWAGWYSDIEQAFGWQGRKSFTRVVLNETPDKVGDYFIRIAGKEIYELKKETNGYILREVGKNAFWHYHEDKLEKAFGNASNGGRDKFKKVENPANTKKVETPTPAITIDEDKVGDKFVNIKDGREYTLEQNDKGEYALTRFDEDGDKTTRAGWYKKMNGAFGLDKREGYTKVGSTPEKHEDKVGDQFVLKGEKVVYTMKQESDGKYALYPSHSNDLTWSGKHTEMVKAFGATGRHKWDKVNTTPVVETEDKVGDAFYLEKEKEYYILAEKDGKYVLICGDEDGYKGYTRCGWHDTIAGVFTGIYKRNSFKKVDLNTLSDCVGARYKINDGNSTYIMTKKDNSFILINEKSGQNWYSTTESIEDAFAPKLVTVGGRDKFTRIS